jgi:hypothetical protein
MANNTCILKIFKDKSKLDDYKVYICTMTQKIIDIKNKILKDNFSIEFNYLDFENIGERVYKDYGKLFFDKGLLPRTIDNYILQDFTIEYREFSFLCIPLNICEKPKLMRNNYNNSRKNVKIDSIYKTRKNEDLQQINTNSFVFNENDFPPLK